ncbi:MAG: hypothetical protein ACYC3X_30890 [Pirellulaceae bacterium]
MQKKWKKQMKRNQIKRRIPRNQQQNVVPSNISPEAMTEEQFFDHLNSMGSAGLDYLSHLHSTNGSTEPKDDDDPAVVWGLRSKLTGRWYGIHGKDGRECLLVTQVRSLAHSIVVARLGMDSATTDEKEAAVAQSLYDIVWMSTDDFREKVRDTVTTGFPKSLSLLWGRSPTGRTREEVMSCRHMVTPEGFAEFRNILAIGSIELSWWRDREERSREAEEQHPCDVDPKDSK